MTEPRAKRRPPPRERRGSDLDVNQSASQLDSESDDGIVLDERGQEQPASKEQAQRGSGRERPRSGG